MAKLMCEYDTITKELIISKDGKALDNVENVEMFRMFTGRDEERKFHAQIIQSERSEDDDMIVRTVTMAKNGSITKEDQKKSYSEEIREAIAKRYG